MDPRPGGILSSAGGRGLALACGGGLGGARGGHGMVQRGGGKDFGFRKAKFEFKYGRDEGVFRRIEKRVWGQGFDLSAARGGAMARQKGHDRLFSGLAGAGMCSLATGCG